MRTQVRAWHTATLAGLVALACGATCSRADVYPITGGPGTGVGGAPANAGGAPGDAGGAPADAGSGSGTVACTQAALPAGDSNRTVSVAGQTRSYVLHVPAAYDAKQAVPLVVDFHGVGESGSSERASSPYPAVTDREGVVMAFPDGLRGPAGTAWNVGPCCVADVDDVAFARALVAQIQTLACIDRTRVYAVGVLTGGGLAHYVACHAADVFAAVAPAAFDLLEENVDTCAPARGISVISFRGNGTSRVPYEGGPSSLVPGMPITFLGAQGTFDAWARIDGCTGAATAVDANGCTSRSTCRDGAEVVLCTKQGGREEPGDATVAWPVLRRHAL